jgi:hypothetical protein
MTNLNRSLQIFFWGFAFIYVVMCSLQITQVDLWWQLSEGARILHTGTLPTAPAAAFGLPASPYFDEYAGYEVVLALLFKIAGFPGLWMIFVAVYLAVIFLPIATSTQKYPAFDFSSTMAMLFCGILMKERLEQRPELVGALLLVLLLATLRKSLLENVPARTLAVLFFIFVVWTNTHSTFVIGFFTLGQWIACEVILKFNKVPAKALLRGALAMGGIALVAAMVNPYGPRRLLFPFLQAFDPGSTALSVEMWPINDFTTVAGILAIVAISLLVWGILTTRNVPLWLILFSLFAVVISLRSFRFINILAIAVLFVYAARAESAAPKKPTSVLGLALAWDVALCLLCVFLIFGDAYGFIFTYEEMRAENRLATHTRRFAPDICALRVSDSNVRVPALCGHGTGSYLSFAGNSPFRPLLDSGLSHFSSDTKRYFFFLWDEPAAFYLALQDLQVNYVIVNQETFHWTSTLHQLPGWELLTCDADGMLWKRSPDGPHPLSPAQKDQVEKVLKDLKEKGETVSAFEYSTLLDKPAESLGILEESTGRGWSAAFFNSFCAWVDLLAPSTINEFLAAKHERSYPLVDAILSARLGPDVLAKFVATDPPGPRPWFWQALQVRAALQKGDRNQARTLFETISPAPLASVAYYRLWHQVHPDPAALNAYGRWQTWDDEARQLIESMSARLNDRMMELDRPPGS